MKSFPPHISQCLALHPAGPPGTAEVVVLAVLDVLVLDLLVLGGLVVADHAVVLAVVVGFGFPGAHGLVPPPGFVIVVAELPSQYPTHPLRLMFLNTVLMPFMPFMPLF